MFGRIRMKANEAFKKFFSLGALKRATIYLFTLMILSVLLLPLALFQPWRYLNIAHPSDLILPKDPMKTPKLIIIEAPKLKLEDHKEELHPKLPPLYTKLPSDLPKEVQDYIEKRNALVLKLKEDYISSNTTEASDSAFKKLIADENKIIELLPFQNSSQEGFIATKKGQNTNEFIIFDSSFNIVEQTILGPKFRYIVSANHMDRCWIYCGSTGATGIHLFYEQISFSDGKYASKVRGVGFYDNFLFPLATMKIIHPDTNPEMAVHIKSPTYGESIISFVTAGFFSIGLLVLLLLYIISLVQKNKQNKAKN
jgi:hypothetical protein